MGIGMVEDFAIRISGGLMDGDEAISAVARC
jgi:hypothetical protein